MHIIRSHDIQHAQALNQVALMSIIGTRVKKNQSVFISVLIGYTPGSLVEQMSACVHSHCVHISQSLHRQIPAECSKTIF